jgi:hypothetical protein
MSINDTDGLYYTVMREKMAKWIKGVVITPYSIPADFKTDFIPDNFKMCYQRINGVWVPRNQLSMYYNDGNAFKMACDYSAEHGFEYDLFMRFRSDIFNTAIPTISPVDPSTLVLYSVVPGLSISFGKHIRRPVSSDWVWGNKKTMAIYCNTYEYVLQNNRVANGNYLFHYESNHTDHMVSSGVQIEYHKLVYNVDANRKLFDDTWKLNENGSTNDSRGVLPRNNTVRYIDNSNISDTLFVPCIAE